MRDITKLRFFLLGLVAVPVLTFLLGLAPIILFFYLLLSPEKKFRRLLKAF